MKLISIIIPVLNEEKILHRLLSHLQKYIDSQSEILVIGCEKTTDYTESVCKNFDVKYIIADGYGRSLQMNFGANAAKGEIFCFLHADVLPDSTFLTHIRSSLNSGFRFGFFSYRFEPSNRLLNINASFTSRDGIFSGGGDQIHFMDKKLFKELGGYNEKLNIMEDFDFFQKVKKKKVLYKIVAVPAIVSSRKYLNNSYLKVNLTNLLVFVLWRCNVSTDNLKKLYKRLLNS
ncbi:MAG: glycosyltransferase [Saprospiraceae bacterium]|nr:glycosyltransferase [Saprospiraceae bacterium]